VAFVIFRPERPKKKKLSYATERKFMLIRLITRKVMRCVPCLLLSIKMLVEKLTEVSC